MCETLILVMHSCAPGPFCVVVSSMAGKVPAQPSINTRCFCLSGLFESNNKQLFLMSKLRSAPFVLPFSTALFSCATQLLKLGLYAKTSIILYDDLNNSLIFWMFWMAWTVMQSVWVVVYTGNLNIQILIPYMCYCVRILTNDHQIHSILVGLLF